MSNSRVFRGAARVLASLGFCALLGAAAPGAYAGPVIIGGDDLTDHGSASPFGVTNLEGWLYIEKAIQNMLPQVTRPGHNGRIAALGSASSTGSDAGAAILSAATKLGVGVDFYRNDADISTFFAQLQAGTANPAIIWISGDGAGNDCGDNTGGCAVLGSLGNEISAFVGSGGGLMSHGSLFNWLSAVLPGLTAPQTCSNPVTLTPAGQAAFPGLSNADVDAGPCHNTFAGNFGGLQVLARDSSNAVVILGGGAGTTISGSTEIPTLSEWGLILLATLLAGATFWMRRRQR